MAIPAQTVLLWRRYRVCNDLGRRTFLTCSIRNIHHEVICGPMDCEVGTTNVYAPWATRKSQTSGFDSLYYCSYEECVACVASVAGHGIPRMLKGHD